MAGFTRSVEPSLFLLQFLLEADISRDGSPSGAELKGVQGSKGFVQEGSVAGVPFKTLQRTPRSYILEHRGSLRGGLYSFRRLESVKKKGRTRRKSGALQQIHRREY